jgi:hypothetical protein
VTYGNRAPDAIDPRVGWRVWDVVELDGSLRLCSLAFWSIWLPRRPAVAACRRSLVDRRAGIPDHDAPDERCTCGIYATATPRAAVDFSRQSPRRSDTIVRVLGRVSLWGSVVEGTAGWRGAEGYPESLIVNGWTRGRGLRGRLGPSSRRPPEEIALALEEYGIPVDLVHVRNDRALVEMLERGPGA